MSRFGGTSIIIRSMILQQTGTFHTVYNRPFNMELDDRMKNNIRERILGAGTGPITDKSFYGISGGILAPVAQVDSRRDEILIPDGWDRPRCRFMMEVDVESNLGENSTYFLQGFSDHLGLTASGNVDHNMVFFINGFIRVQYANRRTRMGEERFGIVKSSAQVINGKLIYDEDRTVSLTRTNDLFSDMQRRFYDDGYSEGLDDSRSSLRSRADSVFALRADNLPGRYLSSALGTYRRNTDMQAFGVGREDVLARTQAELSSNIELVRDNPFLRALASLQGVPESTQFTINDLLDLDPDCGRPGIIQGGELDSRAVRQLAHTDNDVSDWRGATIEAQWATQLSNSIAAIMMGNYHTYLKFTADNNNFDHRIIVVPSDATPVAENLPEEIFDRMMDAIEDVMFDMSGGNRDDFSVEITANLYDQTELFISVNGDREQRFFVPSFADSLMSPFYSRDGEVLTKLSSDMEGLINEMTSEISGSASAVARGI